MKNRCKRIALAVALLVLTGCAAPTLRIIAVNLAAADKSATWDAQRDLLAELTAATRPDILAVQAADARQTDELRTRLRGYECIATGADDGANAGEVNPLFVRTARLAVVDRGHFWLSETPQQVGSVDWDATAARVATWAQVRMAAGGIVDVRVVNTRFDADGPQARRRSAELLKQYVESLGSQPVVLALDPVGDANSPPYTLLTRDPRYATNLLDVLVEHTRRGGGDARRRREQLDAARSPLVLVNLPTEVVSATRRWAEIGGAMTDADARAVRRQASAEAGAVPDEDVGAMPGGAGAASADARAASAEASAAPAKVGSAPSGDARGEAGAPAPVARAAANSEPAPQVSGAPENVASVRYAATAILGGVVDATLRLKPRVYLLSP